MMIQDQKIQQVIPIDSNDFNNNDLKFNQEPNLVLTQFYKDLQQCSYVKIKNLESQKYLV